MTTYSPEADGQPDPGERGVQVFEDVRIDSGRKVSHVHPNLVSRLHRLSRRRRNVFPVVRRKRRRNPPSDAV
jgi:hypothetical protein